MTDIQTPTTEPEEQEGQEGQEKTEEQPDTDHPVGDEPDPDGDVA